MTVTFSRIGLAGSALAAVLAVTAGSAHAQLVDAGTFKNLTYSQGGLDGSVITTTGAFFNAGVDMSNPGDFDGVTLTFPGAGSPISLPQTSPTSFGIGPSFATQAAMDTAFPMGTYTLTATNSVTSAFQTEVLDYTTDAYAGNVPALTGSSYDALQGLNTSASSLALDFNSQLTSPAATADFTFFTIFGSNQSCALSPSDTSCVIDPHALTAGTTYTYELDFSNRIESNTDGTLDGVDFDVRTDGAFTTAAAPVPETSSWLMMLLGLGSLGLALRARRKGFAATA